MDSYEAHQHLSVCSSDTNSISPNSTCRSSSPSQTSPIPAHSDSLPHLLNSSLILSSVAQLATSQIPVESQRETKSACCSDLITFDDVDPMPSCSPRDVQHGDVGLFCPEPTPFDTLFHEVEDRMHKLFQRYDQLKERRKVRKGLREHHGKVCANSDLISLEVEIGEKVLRPDVLELRAPSSVDDLGGGSDSSRTSITTSSYSRFPAVRNASYATEFTEQENKDPLKDEMPLDDDTEVPLDQVKEQRLQRKIENLRELFEQALRHGRNRDLESPPGYRSSSILPSRSAKDNSSGDAPDGAKDEKTPAQVASFTESGLQKQSIIRESSHSSLSSKFCSSCYSDSTCDGVCSIRKSSGDSSDEASLAGSARTAALASLGKKSASVKTDEFKVVESEKLTYEVTRQWKDESRIGVTCGNQDETEGDQMASLQYHNPPASLQDAFQCHKQMFLRRCHERQEQILRNREIRKMAEEQLQGTTDGCAVNPKPSFRKRTEALPCAKIREKPDLCKPLRARNNLISLKTAKEETERRLKQFEPPKKTATDKQEETKCRRRRLMVYSRQEQRVVVPTKTGNLPAVVGVGCSATGAEEALVNSISLRGWNRQAGKKQ